MQSMRWYALPKEQVEEQLEASEHGLATAVAKERLATHGANALPEARPDSILIIFLRQFASPLIYILLGAAAIVYFTEDPVDAYIILAILFFNAIVGTIQEGKAQNTLRALKSYATT